MNNLEAHVKDRMSELLRERLPHLGLDHSFVESIISGLEISHDRINGGHWSYRLTSIFGRQLLHRVSTVVQAAGGEALGELLTRAQKAVDETFKWWTAASDADLNSADAEQSRQRYADAVTVMNELKREIGQGF